MVSIGLSKREFPTAAYVCRHAELPVYYGDSEHVCLTGGCYLFVPTETPQDEFRHYVELVYSVEPRA